MACTKVLFKGLGLDIVLNAMLWYLGALFDMFGTNRATLHCLWSQCKSMEYAIFGRRNK